MRFCCLSDQHGDLPKIPDCDALLLSGDFGGDKDYWWLRDYFAPWISAIAERNIAIFATAGNHDLLFEKKPDLIPRMPWTYLQDSGCKWRGLNIYGTPWQPRHHDWAFNLDEPELSAKWSRIPDNTDILLVHGPPRGYGDFSCRSSERTGSPSLTARLFEVQPKLVVCGHIHEGYGEYKLNDTLIINAARCNVFRQPTNALIVVDL